MVCEDLDVIAQLAQSCRSSSAGQTGTDDEDRELLAVQGRDQLEVLLSVIPLVGLRESLHVRSVVL